MTTEVEVLTTSEAEKIANADSSVAGRILGIAQALVVETHDHAIQAEAMLSDIRNKAQTIEAERKRLKAPILEAGKRIDDLFRGPADLLAEATSEIKIKIQRWMFEQERIRKEEERKAAEAARKEEERLLALAAENERKAAEALAAGNAKAAERFETKAAVQAEKAAIASIQPIVTTQPPKVKGIAVKDNFDAECVDLVALVKSAASGNQVAMGLLMFNAQAGKKLAGAVKGNVDIPGIRMVNRSYVAGVKRT